MTFELNKAQTRILRQAAKQIKAKPEALAALVVGWAIDECADAKSGVMEWATDVLSEEPDVPGWLQ